MQITHTTWRCCFAGQDRKNRLPWPACEKGRLTWKVVQGEGDSLQAGLSMYTESQIYFKGLIERGGRKKRVTDMAVVDGEDEHALVAVVVVRARHDVICSEDCLMLRSSECQYKGKWSGHDSDALEEPSTGCVSASTSWIWWRSAIPCS